MNLDQPQWRYASGGGRNASRHAQIAVALGTVAVFGAIATQLLLLGTKGGPEVSLAAAEPVATSFSRPDIVDRNGRLLATDLEAPSIFVDPSVVLDRDELVEKVATVLPGLNQAELRAVLADKQRRFVWVRRHVSPQTAQRVHDLGIPGLSFRSELIRAYPGGKMAGHVLGAVNVDNKGVAGIERYIDEQVGVEAVHSARLSTRPPVRLSLDIGVQHALEDELDTAMRRYATEGAAGVVLDITTGEVLASASLPRIDPVERASNKDERLIDRVSAGSYELGSVFKIMTLAMAFDEGLAQPTTMLDVRDPLIAGRFTIKDMHAAGRPLSAKEVFTHSSNVGAGMLALQAGEARWRPFLAKVGLFDRMTTEAGPLSVPQLPPKWERAEIITTAYGHGVALAPLQFATATGSILNGGTLLKPTFLKSDDGTHGAGKPIVTAETARRMAVLFRQNVTDADGTGKRADVEGYRVGGKTGTADRADVGGYDRSSVLSSFLAAFPMDAPRYVTFVLLFEPKATEETNGQRTASTNAAPVTGRVIARIAPQLGVAPLNVATTQ